MSKFVTRSTARLKSSLTSSSLAANSVHPYRRRLHVVDTRIYESCLLVIFILTAIAADDMRYGAVDNAFSRT